MGSWNLYWLTCTSNDKFVGIVVKVTVSNISTTVSQCFESKYLKNEFDLLTCSTEPNKGPHCLVECLVQEIHTCVLAI